MEKRKIVTLCGSTKFKEQFQKIATELTMKGVIVLMPHCYEHVGDGCFSSGVKDILVDIHNQMIDMSDEILVINVNGYIGESTSSEIAYALKAGKKVNYIDDDNEKSSDWMVSVYDEIDNHYTNISIHANTLQQDNTNSIIVNGAILRFDEPITIASCK